MAIEVATVNRNGKEPLEVGPWVSSSLYNVSGTVITSMSDATVLVGYSEAVNTFGARGIIFEIFDVATGTQVAPSAIAVDTKADAAQSAWSSDNNFGSVIASTGVAANFLRSTKGRVMVMPVLASASPMLPHGGFFICDQVRLKITIGSTANLFTPQIRYRLVY